MSEYDKKIENIIKELDSIEEGLFGQALGKVGQAIKGVAQGVTGEKRTSILDKEAEGRGTTAAEKGYSSYVSSSGSEALEKADAGEAEYYQIGKNKVLKVDKKLEPFLHFEIDKEKQKKGNVVYVANAEKAFKRNPQLEWLFKGEYDCKSLSLTTNAVKGRGTIRGKAIVFVGIWHGGAFMGVLKSGEINGGQIIDGYYIAKAEGFKIKPWDFKSGGLSVATGFAFGLRLAKDNTKHKSLSLVQVPSNKIIKIIDNNDKEHLINMDKGVDYTSLNMKINGSEVSWENYNKSEGDFKSTYMTVGNKLTIPGVLEIDKGIQSIEVKSKEYEGGDEETKKEKKETKGKSSKLSKDSLFDVKSKVNGWTPPKRKDGSAYYLLDIDVDDEDLVGSIKKYKDDINSDKFFKYLNFFRSLIDDGRVDGFGDYPELAFIFPKTKGKSFESSDSKRDSTLKYFGRFREDVIDNFKSEKIGNYYKELIKKQLKGDVPKKTKSKSKKKVVKKAPRKKAQSVVGKGVNEFYNKNLSLSEMLKEVIENQ